MICALQNGSYGSRLISTDYTDEENARMGSLVSDLGTMEQYNCNYIDSMCACSTNVLSQEIQTASLLRLYPIVVHDLVRQESMTLRGQDASTPTRRFKRSRSSSADSIGSDQDNESESCAPNDDVAPAVDQESAASCRQKRVPNLCPSIEAHVPCIKYTPLENVSLLLFCVAGLDPQQ